MNIELRKWSVEDKEVLIKMCNSIDRSFLSDRLPKEMAFYLKEKWKKQLLRITIFLIYVFMGK